MDVEAAARAWADGWARGWAAEQPDAIGALYTDDAQFRSYPFREARHGSSGVAAYAAESFAEEHLVRCWFGEPVAHGDRAAVEYWAILSGGAGRFTIAGVALLRFAASGRCAEQRDTWVHEDGEHEPPPGWGR